MFIPDSYVIDIVRRVWITNIIIKNKCAREG